MCAQRSRPHAPVFEYENPLIRRAARPGARLRLFCLPFGGGGASAFSRWPALLRDDIEVLAVQLPGREDRILDEAVTEVRPLIRGLVQAMRPYLTMPVAVFGHSGGGAMAYELAIALRQRLRFDLTHLFISGQPAPGITRARKVHTLSDDEFARFIGSLGGSNTELLEDDDARSVILPPIRADFAMWETHQLSAAAPLDTPITVFGGADDPIVRPADLAPWRERTTGKFRVHLFPGGHFFINAHSELLIEQIGRDLDSS